MRLSGIWLVASLCFICSGTFATTTAHAAFPGANGRIAFHAGSPTSDQAHIYTLLPDGSGLQAIGPKRSFSPSWSADGERLAFTKAVRGHPAQPLLVVKTMKADGSNVTMLARAGKPANSFAPSPSYSPTGRRVAYSTGSKIYSIRADGTDRELLLRAGRRPGIRGNLYDPEYSPSGKQILFAGMPAGERNDGVWTMRRDGSRIRLVTPRAFNGPGLSWSSDGREIAYSVGSDLQVVDSDGTNLRVLGSNLYFPAWAPDGTQIAVRGVKRVMGRGCSDLLVTDPFGDGLTTVTDGCAQVAAGGLGLDVYQSSWQPLP
jgi:Tol biopolymer transport system component